MKYIITESKLNSFIYEYLSKNLYPDYGWGPDIHEFFFNEVKNFGSIKFLISDEDAYMYIGKINHLRIKNWIITKLNDLFGNRWKDIFIKWFEDNTGLPVDGLFDWDE